MEDFLRRYTELPYVIDYLYTGELALLNPATWDDRNDSFYLEEYARRTGLKSVYALCLANCEETYHHWRVFSHGSGGACIQFKPDRFKAAIAKMDGVRSEHVQYKTIDELNLTKPTVNQLPFLKRYAFKNEVEFRLFYATRERGSPTHRVLMPKSAIDRIILSPWVTKSVAINVKHTLRAIPGCSDIKIYRSTLVENDNWKNFANSIK